MNEIDLNRAEKEFENYTNEFLRTSSNEENKEKIQLKIDHTYRVEKLCIEIAKSIGLNEEQINLAGLIGLLHDIGRFEQLKRFDTYIDRESIDHADLGKDILIKENLIRKFVETDKYDRIILTSVEFHNKYEIPESIKEPELTFAKIVRDGDKIDILNLLRYTDFKLLYNNSEFEEDRIGEKVYNSILGHKEISYKDMETALDRWAISFAYVFDINFPYSLQVIKEKDYINQLIDRINYKNEETKQKIQIIRKVIDEYINDVLNK